ncbi:MULTISPECIES: Dabb family protein [Serratia]|uniref:Dabb family protein n=1 Tax=Serratia TaxID=613 RepID=UPI002363181F|nr:Dabb family protein [Serratia bockelmannii]BEN62134.1 hypothetical protein SMKC069_48250 [Serratia marcescens]
MDKFVGVLLFLTIVVGVYAQGGGDNMFNKLNQQRESIGNAVFTASDYKPGLLKHIVLFKFNQEISQAQKDDVANRFLSLKRTIRSGDTSPYILSIVDGMQNSGEGASDGFEMGFIVTFKSEGDRNYYVGRPLVDECDYYDEDHDEFKRFVRPLLDDEHGVLVFDFSLR